MIKNWIKRVKFFNPNKVDKLYYDIEILCCGPHDNDFEKGGGIIDFIKANLLFIERLLQLLQWTTTISRILIFIIFFIWLNIIGIKYFNWTKRK